MFKINELSTTYLNTQYEKYDFQIQFQTQSDSDQNKYYSICLQPDADSESASDGIYPFIPNVIRRIGISEIPIFAPEVQPSDIDNHSQYDIAVLADRVRFITVNTDFIEENNYADYKFKISAEYKSGDRINKIHLHDDGVLSSEPQLSAEVLRGIFPHNMLLFTLKPCEYVHISFVLEQGIGLMHSKWTTGLVTYKFHTDMNAIDQSIKDVNAIQKAYTKSTSQINNPMRVDMNFESYNKITAKSMYSKSIDILIAKLQHFFNIIDAIDDEKDKPLVVKIDGETHTLGNYLENIFLIAIKNACETYEQMCSSYAYYQKPDETKDTIIFYLRLAPELDIDAKIFAINVIGDYIGISMDMQTVSN